MILEPPVVNTLPAKFVLTLYLSSIYGLSIDHLLTYLPVIYLSSLTSELFKIQSLDTDDSHPGYADGLCILSCSLVSLSSVRVFT